MCKVPTVSEFDADAKRDNNLDDLRAIASQRGFTTQQIQDAIDIAGSDATLVAERLHLALHASTNGSLHPIVPAQASPARVVWNTLEELREVALAEGLSATQIAAAMQAAGDDPRKVAHALQKQLVESYLNGKHGRLDEAAQL